MHIRRYCLLQAIEAKIRGEDGLYFGLINKQAESAGVPLSSSLPGYARLVAAGYACNEDVIGAQADELIRVAGLNRREANAVIAALPH